eukprot:1148_1
MSFSDTFIKLNCSQRLCGSFPKPSYHPSKSDVVIISTPHWEPNKGIYEYDLRANIFTKIHTYDDTFTIFGHGQFIYPSQSLLYIFAAGELGVFDLNNKIMYTHERSALRTCCKTPKTAYITSINECHILSNDNWHYTMDMNNKKITKMDIDIFKHNNIKWPNLCCVPFTEQLMSFGSHYGDKIWYCNINTQISNKREYNWLLHDIKMPHNEELANDYFDILLVFDSIIFIFYFRKKK